MICFCNNCRSLSSAKYWVLKSIEEEDRWQIWSCVQMCRSALTNSIVAKLTKRWWLTDLKSTSSADSLKLSDCQQCTAIVWKQTGKSDAVVQKTNLRIEVEQGREIWPRDRGNISPDMTSEKRRMNPNRFWMWMCSLWEEVYKAK